MAYLILPISVRTFLDLLVSVGYLSVSSFPEKILASHGPVGMHRILGKTQGFVVLFVFVMVSRSLGKNASDISAYLYLFENADICVCLCICICICWYSLNGRQTSSDTPVSVSAPTNPPISSAMVWLAAFTPASC